MFEERLRAEFGRYFCRRCADSRIAREGRERFSMGIYAGTLCWGCWSEDGRNHDRSFDPDDAGECMDAE